MKKFSKCTFLLILAILLTACNSSDTATNEENDANDNKEASSEQVEIIVSAAASLTDVAEEIKAKFNEQHPNITVTYNFGSSGKLSQQINQGAPADIFMSASTKDMDFLADNQLIIEDTRIDFAGNSLVVITQESKELEMNRLEDIATIEADNIVFGEVESMPVGRYGKEALEKVGVWEDIESKLVFGSTVNQILTHIQEGNGELGVVFKTDAIRGENVKIIHNVDSSLHGPVIYPAAAVSSSENVEAAKAYLDFLKSEEGKAIFEAHGFNTN